MGRSTAPPSAVLYVRYVTFERWRHTKKEHMKTLTQHHSASLLSRFFVCCQRTKMNYLPHISHFILRQPSCKCLIFACRHGLAEDNDDDNEATAAICHSSVAPSHHSPREKTATRPSSHLHENADHQEVERARRQTHGPIPTQQDPTNLTFPGQRRPPAPRAFPRARSRSSLGVGHISQARASQAEFPPEQGQEHASAASPC